MGSLILKPFHIPNKRFYLFVGVIDKRGYDYVNKFPEKDLKFVNNRQTIELSVDDKLADTMRFRKLGPLVILNANGEINNQKAKCILFGSARKLIFKGFGRMQEMEDGKLIKEFYRAEYRLIEYPHEKI